MPNCDSLISQLLYSAPTDITTTTDTVVSARKAVDFLDGDQIPWMEQLLSSPDRGIKNWYKRGFIPLTEDFLGMVVRRSANTYQQQPERKIFVGESENEVLSDSYRDILDQSGAQFFTNDIDELSRLLKVALTLVQYDSDTGKFLLSNLGRHNCAVVWDAKRQEIIELMYTADICYTAGSKMFTHWTPDTITDIEWNGETGKKKATEPNPYGMIPVAVRYDISPPRQGFWPKPAWEQLINVNESINLFHTTTSFAANRANIGQFFTNARLPENTVFGVDTVAELKAQPGETVFAEYRIPPEQVGPFSQWLKEYKEAFAEQWGVNLRVDGNGTADSGFKLIVEEFPSLELRNKRLTSAEVYEKQLFKAVSTLANYHDVARFPDGATVDADFAPPRLPVNDKEQWDIWKEKIASGVSTVEDYWKSVDPDISEKEIEEKKRELQAARANAMPTTPPTFEGIADAE